MWTSSVRLALILTWLCSIKLVQGTFNLFMNQTEAKRVLGVNGRIYFIRSGSVMKNAAKFDMRIPSRINCLGFTWFRETASHVTYSLTIQSLSPKLLLKPVINIKKEGQVPIKKKGFCLRMKCRGDQEGTALVQMNMTFASISTGFLSLSVTRLKTCRKVSPVVGSKSILSEKENQKAGDKEVFSSSEKTKVFYIAVGVACSIIFIIALAVAAIHVHSMPSPNKDGNSVSDVSIHGHTNMKTTAAPEDSTVHTNLLDQPTTVAIPPIQTANYKTNGNNTTNPPRTNQIPVHVQINQPHSNNLAPPRTRFMTVHAGPGSHLLNGDIPSATSRTQSISSSVMGPSIRNMSESSAPSELYPHAGGLISTQRGKYGNRDIKAELQPMDVDMDRITFGELLYEGTFARIYAGVLTGPDADEFKQQSVLVKTVSEIASTQQVNLMLIESSMLRDLTHKNLLPIMSVCLEDEKQPLVMFQYMNRGNLKLFLKKSRSPEGMSKSITTADLVHIGIQIAKGMQYLARRKIVHKDLAARNCFLDDELNVKVTDCALSRDLFPNDYCCLCDNENRPVKWMAVESLEHNRYSVASDVWAYGVLLWELMTLAQQPYANIDAFEMLNFLKKGHRIAQPLNCPDELFTVIACCWALSEDERPSFGQLIACITEFNNALSNFV